MMLFDEIRGFSKNNPMHQFYEPFIKALDDAVPFEIDSKVAVLTQAIKRSPASKIEDMSRWCKPPFRKTWIEWVGASVALSGDKPDPELEQRATGRFAPPPRRFGVLIHAIDETMSRFTICFAWRHDNPRTVTISPFSHTFDMNEEPMPVADLAPALRPSDLPEYRKRFARFSKETDEVLTKHIGRAGIMPNPFLAKFWVAVAEQHGVESPKIKAEARNWLDDIQGEGGFAEALLIVMNSRNLTSISEPPDMAKLNKKRRIMGRPPLAAFRSVTINLSKIGQRKADDAAEGGHYREHLVRGHFKIRKSGIFWWSPFVRGDASIGSVTRTKYEVKP